jgi:hypothetical protein
MELALDCTRATSQVVALEQGYVFAHLLLPGPGDTPWTGAVGGVRVTGEVHYLCSASGSPSSLSSPAETCSAVRRQPLATRRPFRRPEWSGHWTILCA